MSNSKQVIVMRNDLNMRKGKMVAQGAHASLKVFLNRQRNGSVREIRDTVTSDIKLQYVTQEMREWINDGLYTKICLYVESKEELLDIYNQAKEKNLPTSLIKDAALTEFDEPKYTACAIGPAKSEKIDKITGDLPLL